MMVSALVISEYVLMIDVYCSCFCPSSLYKRMAEMRLLIIEEVKA